MQTVTTGAGNPLPLGSRQFSEGVNFALFSRHASTVSLLLFNSACDALPALTLPLDSCIHRTGDIWHMMVYGIQGATLYAWQVDGPDEANAGHRFAPDRMLLDPYAQALAGTDCQDFSHGCDTSDPLRSDAGSRAKCLLTDNAFDWQGDCPPAHPWCETIIYETHVRGLTIHPSAMSRCPGTFSAISEKIPYLKELGITALELLPVQEFYENELIIRNPETGEHLRNYWGYSTVAFFAPKESYGSRHHDGCQVDEFKTMVKALHQAGIEIILDIVFNHTAEGDHTGPTLNFRGLDNSIYYLLEEDRRFYKNYSGTGNTLNCNHPVVRDYILDCLRHWVIDMHVDGFRFDLASVLGRDASGDLLPNPPLLERIAEDPILSRVKLIAEAWDAAGAYQVGSFPGMRWSEWNGQYRDDVRRFWRGDAGITHAFASRLCGSSDIYMHSGKSPLHSINFITCHDGFTLNDLVSYGQKHNEANAENNRDGCNENYSCNYGTEGADDNLEELRLRQIKNMLATLLLSRGVPMLLGGDEFRRSQQGNNNAYCQDNEISWYNWELLQQHAGLHHFVRHLIALRRSLPVLCSEHFYSHEDVRWFGPDRTDPDWHGPHAMLGCTIHAADTPPLCMLFNATAAAVLFNIPRPEAKHRWRFLIDTTRPAPDIPGQASGWLNKQEQSLLPPFSLQLLRAEQKSKNTHPRS